MAVRELLQMQIGKETTWGTPVTATAKMLGFSELSLAPEGESKVFEDLRSSFQPGYMAAVLSKSGSAKVKGMLTYEDFPYWMDSLFGIATPTGSGPYVYAYAMPVGTAPTPRIMTLVYGASDGVYRMPGSLVNMISLKGESNKEITQEIEFLGKQVVASGSLASLSDRTETVATGNDVAIYIDAWGGTIGSTLISNTFFSFDLKIQSGRDLKRYLGSITPGGYKEGRYESKSNSLKLSLEFGSSTKSILDSIIGTSLTQYQVRLAFTSGTNVINLDFAGTTTSDPEIFADKDGVCTFDMELNGTYNTSLGNSFKSSVTNSVSALV